MIVGDTEYRATLRRWCVLFDVQPRTFAEQVEYEALHKRLDAAERQSVIAQAVDDYDFAVRQVGDLGGTEL